MHALLFGELFAHPGRVLLNVVVIAIGVAMGYAVHVINQSALNEFGQAVRSLQGNADLQVRGPRSGFDEELYPRIAAFSEVAALAPVVEVQAKISGRDEMLRILGIDVFRAAALQPDLIGRFDEGGTADGSPLLDAEALFLSPAALTWLGAAPGDQIGVQVGLGNVTLTIKGTLPSAGAGVRLGVMDIAAAQWRLDRLGSLSRIDVRLRPGIDAAQFQARLNAMLPAGVVATTPDETRERVSGLSRAYRVNLNVLALVALFTGGFLVLSSQTLAVVRRRAELALLRVLGVTRAGVVRLLLIESVIAGAIGSLIGIIGGYAIAALMLSRFGGDLGGGYFNGVSPQVDFSLSAALLFFLLGVSAAALGSAAPAAEAARARPAAALKAGDEETALARMRSPWPGVLLLVAGGALAFAGPIGELPLPGYAAVALLLIGGISLVPYLAQVLFSRLPLPVTPVARLAVAQLSGAPGRAALALSGIVASFSLMVAMAIMVASFRESVDAWLAAILPADLYVRAAAAGDTAYFSGDDVGKIRATAGVAKVEMLRVDQITLDPRRPPVSLIARAIDQRRPGDRLPLVGGAITTFDKGKVPVWVSEPMVDLYGFRPGDAVTLPIGGKAVACVVAGVWRDYARQHGAVVIDAAVWRAITGDARTTDAALWILPGNDPTAVGERLRRQLSEGDAVSGQRLEFAEPGEIRALSLRIFDRSFAVTYLIEAVAVVIGLVGVAASFGAQALARRREFGMLRHLGVTRTQVAGMLAIEGGLLASIGVASGLLLGGAVSAILIYVVNPQSFHWTMDVHIPWATLAAVAVALMVSAAATAVASGRQAMARGATLAVREDW